MMKNNRYYKVKDIQSYFPKILDISLLVCTSDCGRVYLGPSQFVHICDRCGKQFKYLYHLKYKIVDEKDVRDINKYQDLPILEGNVDNSLKWIDDITYDDLINGNIDCLGNINDIYLAFVTCKWKCGYHGLIVSGSSQICPKCGDNCFRWKEVKYHRIQDQPIIEKCHA